MGKRFFGFLFDMLFNAFVPDTIIFRKYYRRIGPFIATVRRGVVDPIPRMNQAGTASGHAPVAVGPVTVLERLSCLSVNDT